ncbi:hypothetical protein [Vagococcus xieshaowenii]|uniref:Niacin transporter n=1 Tax=Vagococcus xieshaowenii TaxID=2562451 RepID=A0AAJ5EFT0_9ENTE|nr:hypothetical protein [Vagococcus xieshaowenii]QCA28339.1 hypothetical protein E4Z98_03060 [Vagococcus xieshaowenii]TFZ42273.1 hypothetical protein E4031_03590 [Vagococcus xieshaowenii]
MSQFSQVKKITFSAILVAIGILIPMVMPIKLMIEPVSFTLASHVPIFLAMFISPGVAIAVAVGTGFGFLLSFPITIALRAFSHVIFAYLGALCLKKNPTIIRNKQKNAVFAVVIGLIHTVVEAMVVFILFINKGIPGAEYTNAYITNMLLILLIGGLIHSVVDYYLAFYIAKRTERLFPLPVFSNSK